MKKVTLGRNLGDSVEVRSGLNIADRLIDSPQEALQSGDSVRSQAPTAFLQRPRRRKKPRAAQPGCDDARVADGAQGRTPLIRPIDAQTRIAASRLPDRRADARSAASGLASDSTD